MASENMALISIIIPVYNVADYLSRCIKSVLSQSYTNIEVILIDDGSTDGSCGICDDYAGKDDRIKVIHQQNDGVSSARNAGIDIATGEYIGFVDSDDWIEPDMYEKLFNAVNGSGKRIAVCGYVEEREGNKYSLNWLCPELAGVVSRDTVLHDIAYVSYFGQSMCNKLFSRSLFESDYPTRVDTGLHVGEDALFVIGAFLKTDGLVYVPESLYHYWQRSDSAMHLFNDKSLSVLRALDGVLKLMSPVSREIRNLARLRYTESLAGIIRVAALCESNEYLPALKKDARKYILYYVMSGKVDLKTKFRSVAVIFFPRLSNYIWLALKRHFGITWWKGLNS